MTRSTNPETERHGTHPDLEALRRAEPVTAPPARRRGWLPRLTIVLVVLGLLGVLYALLQPILFPPKIVRMTPVRMAEGVRTQRGRVLAEAAGWIEADPFPTTVRPLVSGVVDSLHVLEGQTVVKGETLIARLRNVDLENALEIAESNVALREAELALARSHLETDRALLEQRLPQRELEARYAGERSTAEAVVALAAAARVRTEAALATARLDLEALEDLERAGSSAALALRRARARVDEAAAAVDAAEADEMRARADVKRLEGLLAVAREGVSDPRALAGEVAEDEREVARAEAALALARTTLRVAEENVALLTVVAPMDGIVLRLESAPGGLVGPQGERRASSEEGTGSTGMLAGMTGGLVSLYDPAHLQARVDVQFADVGGIGAGSEVEILVAALPGRTFHGVVHRLQHEADILKNTLQVKVRITDPDPLLRPEMLARARFLPAEVPAGEDEPATEVQVSVPAEAVRGGAVFVWDPRGGGRARRVPVETLGTDPDGWTRVEGALGPSHKVILDPVEDGQAVRGEQ
ncbi:MAG: efflux RND transporter periplasmic adaptor subunit [Planctomycetota bacterium]|jgi:multidrug efflux pump subunit AcrA (membrane-fusion protein)